MIGEILQKENLSTTQMTTKQIIQTFSYDANEREAFSYLHRYMKLVSKKLDEIENDEEKLRKFALAGLFLTYRACNHSGSSMETKNLNDIDAGIHKIRLMTFRDYFKTEIRGVNHYLKMIDFSIFDYVLLAVHLKSISRKLYKFVVK